MSAWDDAKSVIGEHRVLAGPQLSQQLLHQPDHLAMVLARYRAAAALIGTASEVAELGCGEGIGAGILANGRSTYYGLDSDTDALKVAASLNPGRRFRYADITNDADITLTRGGWGAVVSLDVIEHLPGEDEDEFLGVVKSLLSWRGVCVIGTPNAAFAHLASPQSKTGHINLYTHDRLYALMKQHFGIVQSFGMQDTSLHLGHPEARHYLMMVGIMPLSG